jgi:hypothetical protein
VTYLELEATNLSLDAPSRDPKIEKILIIHVELKTLAESRY